MSRGLKSLSVRLASPFPPHPRLNAVNMDVDLSHHLGVVGRNASGKRSVLRGLARACVQAGLQVESVDFETHRNAVKANGNETVSRVLGGMRDNADIVVRFGLTSVWWRRLKSLSTGEVRKVLLARAVSRNPDVLILDRPFDGLDARSRKSLLMVLDEVSNTSHAKQARPLVQGIKWQERIPVRLVVATHRPTQELLAKIKTVLRCDEHDTVVALKRDSDAMFIHAERQSLATLARTPIVTIIDDETRDHARDPVLDIQRLTVFPVTADDILEGKDVKRPLLDRVSWCVHPREVWWLQGENGASKSVLLSCALGPERLLRLASHQHATREWAVEEDPEADRRRKRPPVVTMTDSVEMVSTELHISLLESEGTEKLLVGDYLAGKTKNMGRLARTLIDLGLNMDILGRRFRELSTGQQKLVLVAGAVAALPRLMILDEPCQSLDLEHRKRVARLVDSVCASNVNDVACVFVSHHEDELPRSVSHRLVLEKGRVISRGHYHVPGH